MLYNHPFFRSVFRSVSRTNGTIAIGILCGMFLLFVGAAINQTSVRAQDALGIVETEGELLNVREGPSSDYTILYQLEDQSYVEILGTDSEDEWYEVRPEGGSELEGWVFASYVRQFTENSTDDSVDASDDSATAETDDLLTEAPALPREQVAATITARAEIAATEVAKIFGTATAASMAATVAADNVVSEATVTARAMVAATEIAKIVATATAESGVDEATPTPEPTEAEEITEEALVDQLSVDATAEAKKVMAVTVVARAKIASTEIAQIQGTATAQAALAEEGDVEAEGELTETDLPTPTATLEATATLEPTAMPESTVVDEVVDSDATSSAAEGTVDEEIEPTEIEAEDATIVSTATAITVPERMNIYSGPGTHYTTLATVEAGTVFEIVALDAKGRWYQVQAEGMPEMAWLYGGLAETTGDLDALPRIQEAIPTRIPEATPTEMAVADPDVAPTPTLRPLMEASDPATFEIASGQPQVVEFFGFW